MVPVDGFPCGVPGLAITRAWAWMWTATRSRTSDPAAPCSGSPDTDPRHPRGGALNWGSLTDWTRPGTDIAAFREIATQARSIGRRYGAQLYRLGVEADGQDIL